jgi:hypothetical protein
MNLTIFPNGGEVIQDKVGKLNLIWEGTPAEVNALQWFGTEGWIEYISSPTEKITELPQWANNALIAYEKNIETLEGAA